MNIIYLEPGTLFYYDFKPSKDPVILCSSFYGMILLTYWLHTQCPCNLKTWRRNQPNWWLPRNWTKPARDEPAWARPRRTLKTEDPAESWALSETCCLWRTDSRNHCLCNALWKNGKSLVLRPTGLAKVDFALFWYVYWVYTKFVSARGAFRTSIQKCFLTLPHT